MSKDTRKLIKEAKKQGLQVNERRPHYVITSPDKPGVQVVVAKTASDHRALMNAVSRLRREFGFKWKGR